MVAALDAVKLMSHSGQAALGKLAKSGLSDQLLKDWNKTIQELGKSTCSFSYFSLVNEYRYLGSLLRYFR
jgi:hypothetical protein